MTKLSPPWSTIFNEIKFTIGQDPRLTILDVDMSSTPYEISIITDDRNKGESLTTLIAQATPLGNVSVIINVKDSAGFPYQELVISSPEELSSVLDDAFQDNPLYVQTIVKESIPFTYVYPVFTKSVIQFYNDNLADAYSNYNKVTADVFQKILNGSVNGISIGCSSDV